MMNKSHSASFDIATECSLYLNEYNGLPFITWINNEHSHDDQILRLKLRHKKNNSEFDNFFNDALSTSNLRQRALFIRDCSQPNSTPYFIFPPNGYKVLSSIMVSRSQDLNENLFKPLLALNCKKTIQTLFNEILNLHYHDGDPSEALLQGNEIILYNIPYVYAIRKENADFDTIKKTVMSNHDRF